MGDVQDNIYWRLFGKQSRLSHPNWLSINLHVLYEAGRWIDKGGGWVVNDA